MSVHLHTALERLRKLLLAQGARVEEMIARAVKAFETTDGELAHRVIQEDDVIDRAEIEIEEEALKVLALHQPVASDLRFIVTVLKVNNDLERMGDIAVSIARRAVYLSKRPPLPRPESFRIMYAAVREMVKHSLDALVNSDDQLAEQVCLADDAVDEWKHRLNTEMRNAIEADPINTRVYLRLMSFPRHLERIADLATNISEDVIYLVRGEIVRHRNKTEVQMVEES